MNFFPKIQSKIAIHQVIVPEEDHHTFSISHPKHLLLIDTPLATERDLHHGSHSDVSSKHPQNTVHEVHSNHSPYGSHHDQSEILDPDEPVLKRPHEASTIQLFFDLFFVANLTTFTTNHEIDDWDTLKSYLGYFGIIWFTWFQNTLFDVRFSNDSAFERACKALQFGIMTGFAVTGSGYQTGWAPGTEDAKNSIATFKALSLILMCSRLILTFQYSVAFWFIRSYKNAVIPMATHMAVLFTSAMIFLGLSFAFTAGASEHILIAWYCIIALEALVIMLVSGNVKFLSFKPTVLVERLGLLTLIILGEGIIGMCTSINKVGSDKVYSPDVIGNIICSVGIMYFIWMLYFDPIQPERMGTLREHMWAILHFPFHVSILLVVEGLSRLSVWRKLLNIMLPLQESFSNIPADLDVGAQINYLNDTLYDVYDKFLDPEVPYPDLNQYFDQIRNSNGNTTAVSTGVDNIYSGGIAWVSSVFKIEPPKSTPLGNEVLVVNGIFQLFNTVFIYFFTFAGLMLILLAVLFLLGKRHKLRGELLTVFVRLFFGTGLSLIAIMAVPSLADKDGSAFDAYIFSSWMLPTVLLVYLTVIVLDNLLIRYIHWIVGWRKRHADHDVARKA